MKKLLGTIVLLFAAQAHAQLGLTQVSPTDWSITNGVLTMDFNPAGGELWSMFLNAFPADNLIDTTQIGGDGHPKGLYMDNVGTDINGIGNIGVTPTAGFHLDSGHYLDWWITWPASSAAPMTVTLHYVLFPNDPTVWTYYVANHVSGAAQGSFGQVQYLFRGSWNYFVNTYSVNSGLNNLGGWSLTLPSVTDLSSTDPGRAVQNAAEDLHGFTLPASSWGREFYTKYDFSSYEYLHKAHCVYGTQFGACTIIPSEETLIGGPMKQNLIFTENIVMGELSSNHLDNNTPNYVTTGTTTRIWGPVGFQFSAGASPATLYTNAVNAIPGALNNFATEAILVAAGYVPSPTSGGTTRGTVKSCITGGGSHTANTAWTVLSDPNTNMQYSAAGYQYWTASNASGDATLSNVWPGTYRLTSYVLGEWGELRLDGVSVTAGNTTALHGLTFKPENFSPSGAAPVWTIGTPDRSSHEFLHGKNTTGNPGSCPGCDDREYFGNWNYWSDFAANNGSVVYYATAVGSTPATNNTLQWNYTQWNEFDPGLFAGVFNSSDDTTDGYQYVIPSYVATLSGASGTNGVTTVVPPWFVNFATTPAQVAQGGFVDISIGLACVEANLTASLNGNPLTWTALNKSDCSVRSGLSGRYQWVVFEWPVADLAANGSQNTLELTVHGNVQGVEYDALRMEISSSGANPATTGWHDYEYVTSGTYVPANDAVANNN
jgi:Polysaccharide lyase family 4, domain II/Polysaccharide lyase family 4, domain III